MKNIILKVSTIAITLFGLLTLFMSGSIIFDLFGIRAQEGNYVLFIVILNFICGFLYLFSAYGLYFQKKWTTPWLVIAAGLLLLGFVGLLWHIKVGGLYEQQTVRALLFRFGLTSLFAGISWRFISGSAQ